MFSIPSQDTIADFVLLLVILAPLAIAWRYSRRSGFSFVQVLLLFLVLVYTSCAWRLRKKQRLPKLSGGAILVCNHRSNIDLMFMQVAADRPIYSMIARDYYDQPILNLLLRPVPLISTGRRGVDNASMRRAVELAKAGEIVNIMPEGRVNESDQFMLPSRPGATWVALKAGVPVIPCHISGAPYAGTTFSAFLMTADVVLTVGEPYYLPQPSQHEVSKLESRQLAKSELLEVMSKIAELGQEEDYLPQMAGRKWLPES
jgi:1-acyl-sn-glycerol-3-phosphate acyltransferase